MNASLSLKPRNVKPETLTSLTRGPVSSPVSKFTSPTTQIARQGESTLAVVGASITASSPRSLIPFLRITTSSRCTPRTTMVSPGSATFTAFWIDSPGPTTELSAPAEPIAARATPPATTTVTAIVVMRSIARRIVFLLSRRSRCLLPLPRGGRQRGLHRRPSQRVMVDPYRVRSCSIPLRSFRRYPSRPRRFSHPQRWSPPCQPQQEGSGFVGEPLQPVQVPALGAPQHPPTLIQYRLPVFELLLVVAGAVLPRRALIDPPRFCRPLCQPRHMQQVPCGRPEEAGTGRYVRLTDRVGPILEVLSDRRLVGGPPEPYVAVIVHAVALLGMFRSVWIVPQAPRHSQRRSKQRRKQSPRKACYDVLGLYERFGIRKR